MNVYQDEWGSKGDHTLDTNFSEETDEIESVVSLQADVKNTVMGYTLLSRYEHIISKYILVVQIDNFE